MRSSILDFESITTGQKLKQNFELLPLAIQGRLTDLHWGVLSTCWRYNVDFWRGSNMKWKFNTGVPVYHYGLAASFRLPQGKIAKGFWPGVCLNEDSMGRQPCALRIRRSEVYTARYPGASR